MSTQVFAEAEYRRLADSQQRALLLGSGQLLTAVASELARRGITTAVVDDGSFDRDELLRTFEVEHSEVHLLTGTLSPNELISQAQEQCGGLTALITLCMPDPRSANEQLMGSADVLLARNLAAANAMSQTGGGAIVNHCALPVMYAGGPLEDYMSSLRGAVTGVVRTIARKYGRQNVRCVGMQTGLIDLPEVQAWVSESVKAVDVPVKRWGTAAECAKLAAFLAFDASYITGQALILDGGLTAGLSGT